MALHAPPRPARIVLILFVCVVAAVALYFLMPREQHIRGLLVDLEWDGPDSSRYARLREAFTQRLPSEADGLRNTRVTLEYIHFSAVERKNVATADFVLLSPQGTPWHRYDAAGLELAKEIVAHAAIADGIPVLGICGGHQFLALAFGGTVDFIDPTYAGQRTERYPKQAIGEQGVTVLHTLRDDPILSGVATYPGQFRVVENHYEEVKAVPEPFVNLAASALSEVQLMRIPDKLVYGVAFHPERCWDDGDCADAAVPEGKQLLANFLSMVRKRRR